MKKLTLFLFLFCLWIPKFTLAQEPQKPQFSVHGSFDARFILYGANGIENRRSPSSYFIYASPTIKYGELAVPLSFTLSELDRENRQPFSNFGLSPTYKKLTGHFGYRNVTFSDYTLAGHTMYGVGLEWKPKKWDIGIMRGRLNKATAVDSTYGTIQAYDFDRIGTALKVGYGTKDKYVKFNFISAKDDSTSNVFTSNDSLLEQTAQGNFVSAFETKFPLSKKIFLKTKAAFSVYTGNLNSAIELPEEVITIQNILKPFVFINASTELSSAVSVGLGYKADKWGIDVNAERIEPEFKSMGTYYFNDDLLNMTIAPHFVAFKNKWRLNGSLGVQWDNVKNQKSSTTKRLIGSVNSSISFTDKLGLDIVYTNFQSTTQPEVVTVNNKYLLANTTQNFSVNPRYFFMNDNKTHVLFLSYNASNMVDQNSETQFLNEIQSKVVLFNYSLNFNKTKLGITLSPYLNTIHSELFKNNTLGFNSGINKVLLKDKLRLGLNITEVFGIKETDLNTTTVGINGSYTLKSKHRLGLRFNLINNTYNTEYSSVKFTETTGEFGYTLNF